MQACIDLNCDLGESFGAWKMGNDAGVLPYVSSINIACGFHAGDSRTMQQTLELAKMHRMRGLAIGAHTGLPDLRGFGRREFALDSQDLYCDTLYQLGALAALAKAAGFTIRHIKPHGALYHMLEQQPKLANGGLVPRGQPSAVIEDANIAATQVMQVLQHGHVTAIDGAEFALVGDTVCIHGDRADAAEFAAALHAQLTASGVRIGAGT